MTITKDLIEQFKQWVFAGFSGSTARVYSFYVAQFCLGRTVAEVNTFQFFLDLTAALRSKGLALNTIGNYVASCKKFLRYVEDFHGVPTIDLDKVKCKRPKPKEVAFMEMEEVRRVQSTPLKDLSNLLDRTLFEFYLHTGCRVSEGVSLDWRSIDFEKKEVEVLGKGNKPRTVYLGGSAPWLHRYLAERRNTASPLFLTQFGGRLSKKSAFIRVREIGRRAGLKREIFPHLLRATYCTYLIRSGADPKTVQYLMGHDDLETTLRYYYGVRKEDLKVAHTGLEKYLTNTCP